MHIRFALITEGSSDRPLVGVLTRLCQTHAFCSVDGEWVNETLAMLESGKNTEDQLRALIGYDPSFNLIFVHHDADSRDDSSVRDRIAEGVERAGYDGPAVPVVPIQEMEAWVLTDEAAIRQSVGNPNGRASLGLPKPKHIELRANPKELLRDVLVRASRPGRQQRELRAGGREFRRIRRLLLENLDLEGPIAQLSAWQKLVTDTNAALAILTLSQ